MAGNRVRKFIDLLSKEASAEVEGFSSRHSERRKATPLNTREEQIRYRAYLLWLAEGQPEGRDKRHWDEAEAIVNQLPESKMQVDGPLEAPTVVPRQSNL